MSVVKIEEYRQQNGDDILKVFCKPTKRFPEGGNYFYAPADAVDLVQERSWSLDKRVNGAMIRANTIYTSVSFHQELCNFYYNYYVDCIDHINMVDIDNTDDNLNIVTIQQNALNQFRRGYTFSNNQLKLAFVPRIKLNGQAIRPFSQVHREDEVCILQNELEQEFARFELQEDYYMFDFKRYRRGSEDILDLERTGQISEEEATYRHILKYSDNAWYMLRYGLEVYYKEHNISIPQYSLDFDGFMIHPITGQRLCPFK